MSLNRDVKICKDCKIEKPILEFYTLGRKKHLYSSYCKPCSHIRCKNNKEKYRKGNGLIKKRENLIRNRTKIMEYLQIHPCVDCGEPNPVVLEFDHVDEKNEMISRLVYGKWERIENEIKLCEVRCSNCHRIKTGKQFGWWWT